MTGIRSLIAAATVILILCGALSIRSATPSGEITNTDINISTTTTKDKTDPENTSNTAEPAAAINSATGTREIDPAASPQLELDFTPDPGIRIDNASNVAPFVTEDGTVILHYTKKSPDNAHTPMFATSKDGLSFQEFPATHGSHDPLTDPRIMRLPDGSYRRYMWEPGRGGFRSQSSKDGVRFKPDSGLRYTAQQSDDPCIDDNNSIGIYHTYNDPDGNVVLLYIGDKGGPHGSVRMAMSKDNGWTFEFVRGNVLNDCGAAETRHNHVDQKSLLLPDGRRRLFTMVQGPRPPQPPVRSCCDIHSFISTDGGHTYFLESGKRLTTDDFTELDVYSLNDPWVVIMPDGSHRMYVTALTRTQDGYNKEVIVSASTKAPEQEPEQEKEEDAGNTGSRPVKVFK